MHLRLDLTNQQKRRVAIEAIILAAVAHEKHPPKLLFVVGGGVFIAVFGELRQSAENTYLKNEEK